MNQIICMRKMLQITEIYISGRAHLKNKVFGFGHVNLEMPSRLLNDNAEYIVCLELR